MTVESKSTSATPRFEFLLEELYAVLSKTFKAIGNMPAEDLATHAIIAIADHLGGQEVYLPRGDRLRLALRNKAILAAYQEKEPLWKLARQHGLSVERIRQIVKKR